MINASRLVLFLFVIIALNNCKNYEVKVSKNEKRGQLDKVQLKIVGEKNFHLDSLTSPNIESLYLLELKNDTTRFLTFLNERLRKIYFYDYETGEIHSVTQLQKDGPDGIGKASGHYVESLDSIYLYDEWASRMFIVDRNGKKRGIYTFPSFGKSKIYQPVLSLSAVNPMYLTTDK